MATVSKLWSCQTLEDGLQHVDAIAKTPQKNNDDEIILMKELEDSYNFSFYFPKDPTLFLLLALPAGPGESLGLDIAGACQSAGE